MMRDIVHLQIGKNGLSDAFIEQVRRIFENERAVKVSFLKSSTRDRKAADEMAKKLVSALGERYQYHLIGWTLIVKKGRKKV